MFMFARSQGIVTLFTPRTPTAPNLAVEMCAPSESATVVTMSPGSPRANSTAKFAFVPETGRTSAWRHRKRRFASSVTRTSTSSTYVFPW